MNEMQSEVSVLHQEIDERDEAAGRQTRQVFVLADRPVGGRCKSKAESTGRSACAVRVDGDGLVESRD